MVQNNVPKIEKGLSLLVMLTAMKLYLIPVKKRRNILIVHPLKSNTVIHIKRVIKKVGRSNVYELAGTSNAVSIDAVLGDEPIVVTPSSFKAWHGIAIGFMPLGFPR